MTDPNDGDDSLDRAGTDRLHRSFDPTTESASTELLLALAAYNDSDPTELEPLPNVLDPDALDSLVHSFATGRMPETSGRVAFDYNGFPIRITADGTITLDSDRA